ncbi:DUF7383 domain-containing protein [Denitrobaculum tricleocarpae]|uniref:Uncharacterized protein n=1 Tax=Denitrobaculum tricleocarpae TaxID=2591009 RepID=A0A545TMJ8_9PROT|nr:hypothetical protein [Denitrobaculum tricleocarpae]TQV78455.1 hypothetical protein FKG95_17995 [Denitrobaculum tricleocarpae]
MATRSDFKIIHFWDHLGDDKGDISTSATFRGDETPAYCFYVDATPLDGYVVLQAYDVDSDYHEVLINGMALPYEDIMQHGSHNSWSVWLDEIPAKYLKRGNNTIKVKRSRGEDNFIIGDVVVHWRELGA